jgi:hypothetical protein
MRSLISAGYELRTHHATYCIPMMEMDEVMKLAINIKRKGLQQPIVLCDGLILEGRNRFLACGLAGVTPRFVQWLGPESAHEWAEARAADPSRYLTPIERAVAGADTRRHRAKSKVAGPIGGNES